MVSWLGNQLISSNDDITDYRRLSQYQPINSTWICWWLVAQLISWPISQLGDWDWIIFSNGQLTAFYAAHVLPAFVVAIVRWEIPYRSCSKRRCQWWKNTCRHRQWRDAKGAQVKESNSFGGIEFRDRSISSFVQFFMKLNGWNFPPSTWPAGSFFPIWSQSLILGCPGVVEGVLSKLVKGFLRWSWGILPQQLNNLCCKAINDTHSRCSPFVVNLLPWSACATIPWFTPIIWSSSTSINHG